MEVTAGFQGCLLGFTGCFPGSSGSYRMSFMITMIVFRTVVEVAAVFKCFHDSSDSGKSYWMFSMITVVVSWALVEVSGICKGDSSTKISH